MGRRHRWQGGRWWVNKGELVKFSFKQKSKVSEHKKQFVVFRRVIYDTLIIDVFVAFLVSKDFFGKNKMIAGRLDMHVANW